MKGVPQIPTDHMSLGMSDPGATGGHHTRHPIRTDAHPLVSASRDPVGLLMVLFLCVVLPFALIGVFG